MKPKLVGIGEILWDLLPTGKQIGGSPSNFAYHVSALGGECVIVSQVGKDELGEEILSRLGKLGLSTEFITLDENHPTGIVSIELDQRGVPSFTIHESVAWDYMLGDLDLIDLAGGTEAVCFGSLAQRSQSSSRAILEFLRQTSENALRIFDINIRPPYYSKGILEESLELANILKVNDHELSILSDLFDLGGNDFLKMSQVAERFKLRMVALTKGSRGSLLWYQGQRSGHAGYPVEVVDTVGAGDAFTAALALGMIKGFELDQLNDLANKVASFVCTCPGATPPIPTIHRDLFL